MTWEAKLTSVMFAAHNSEPLSVTGTLSSEHKLFPSVILTFFFPVLSF